MYLVRPSVVCPKPVALTLARPILILVFVLLWVSVLWLPAEAEAQRYNFVRYLPAQGISQSQVSSILQDKQGYLWLGTVSGGLNRFDGKRFRSYRWADGLKAVFIRALLELEGELYVGTRQGLFRRVGERFEEIKSASGQILDIYSLSRSPAGELMVSTHLGLYQLDKGMLRPDHRGKLLPSGSVHETLFTSRGEKWAMGKNWIGRFKGMTFTPVEIPPDLQLEAMLADQDDRIWVGTRSGLYYVDGSTLKPFEHPHPWLHQPVTCLFQSRSGTLWVGGRQGAVALQDGGAVIYDEAAAFPSVRVRAIYEDIEGSLYFGTDGEGLLQLPQQPFESYAFGGLRDYAPMSSVVDQRGRRWVATFGSGLWYVEGDRAVPMRRGETLSVPDCISLLLNDDGTLWVGTNGDGLFEVQTQQDELSLKPIPEPGRSAIMSMRADGGRRYVATEEGLWVFDGASWRHFGLKEGLPSRHLMTMLKASSGSFWIGTYDYGAFLWNPKTYKVEARVDLEDGLPTRTVLSLLESSDGTIYFGTNQGLVRKGFEDLEVITTRDGLPDDTVNFVVEDPTTGRLWVGTNRGVGQQLEAGWRVFTYRQGLPDDETNTNAVFWDSRGMLWIGTIHGYGVLVRQPPPMNPTPPAVIIESVYEHDRPLDPAVHAVLKHNQNRIRFEFVGLSYTDPSKVRYRYRLRGLEAGEWIGTQQREVEFAALPDGNYTFELLACNNDGLWTETPVRYAFIIEPPFWDRWWCRILEVALIFFSGALVYKIRTTRLRRQKEMLQKEVEVRTWELKQEKEKSEALLLNILPAPIADEINERGVASPRLYGEVTILFTDFQDFARLCADMSPDELVEVLNEVFAVFDDVCRTYRLEKLKSMGDAFLAAGGLPVENATHAVDAVDAALDMQAYLEDRNQQKGARPLELRIGVHTGPVVAGVIGKRKFAYDIWGDAVNTAARMESLGEAGRVNISRSTYERVREHFVCEPRGQVLVEGKGTLEMFFVKSRRDTG